MNVTIRQAWPDELGLIVQWRRNAAAWLADRGTDQSTESGLSDEACVRRVRHSIDAGDTWIADMDGSPAVRIAVDEWATLGLWSEAELTEALILHRVITDYRFRSLSPSGLLLDHRTNLARQRGKAFVRLDAWTTNRNLHHYYESVGFQFVRIAEAAHTASAALFERSVTTGHTNSVELSNDTSVTVFAGHRGVD